MDPALVERVVQRAMEIQQIPAPTFFEHRRAEYVHSHFQVEGLNSVEMDELGNVFACLPGNARMPMLVVSAHTDTVFPSSTELTLVRKGELVCGPGIGDNSLGVAGLFGLVWALKQAGETLPGDVWLVANVGEEGLGDLCGMKKVVERFGDSPLGYIALEGLAFGRLYHRGLGVNRYCITIETSGGHSWVDFGAPSAIHELAWIIQQLLAIRLPTRKRTTINVGKISGGVSINTIAPQASLELDLRSESGRVLKRVSRKVEEVVHFSQRPGVKISKELIGQRPFGEISADHPLVQLGIDAISRQEIHPDLLIGSTDANVPLSHGYPAICIGLTNGGAAHTVNEFMHTSVLSKGLIQLVDVVVGAFQRL